MARYHSTFTPSQSPPEVLEALFVAREDLARRILDGIRESATSANKQQRLLIGPRGIGKTHLVALLYHRVRADSALAARLRIAWLPEDPCIAGYATLLTLVLRRLQQDEPDLDWLDERLDTVLDLDDTKRQEAMLEGLLLECLDGRTLLLIAENLDDLLGALKEDGQRKLRAFIQNHGQVSILATTTSLIDALTERKRTFYGFFRTHTLDRFAVEEAAALLARLAKLAGNRELENLIWSPLGLARVRAVHYLAGGNPRVYVIFYDFLTRESLDDLVEPFMKLMDELTPYYQARMSRLAPLQRGIIDALRRLRGAVPVKEIARQAMASSQTVSAQLGKLVELGYVIQADSLGRSNYYELKEPLMRLCLEVKEQCGRTVALFVQFLRVWYSQTELDELARDDAARGLEGAHLQEAARLALSEEDPLRLQLKRDFSRQMVTGDHEQALATIEVDIARAPRDKEGWKRKADCLERLNRPLEERLACWERVAEIDPADWLAWNRQGLILSELGRTEEALRASATAVDLQPDDPVLNLNYGRILKRVGRYAEAREYRQKALELAGEPETAADWQQRGYVQLEMDRQDEALSAFRKALELDPRRIAAWGWMFAELQEQGRYRLLHQAGKRIAAMLPGEARFLSYLGIASGDIGRFDQALECYEQALDVDPDIDSKGEPTRLWRAMTLGALGRHNKALPLLDTPQPGYSRRRQFLQALSRADTLMWLDRWDEGIVGLDELLAQLAPPAWTSQDLAMVSFLPVRAHNPQVWRRFITAWLDLFRRHGRGLELGEALVRSMRRFHLDWITDQTARAWLDTWRELAGGSEEFALPLRLLAAGVAYKASRDPRALLALPREERGLLEPWLVNLFKQEPDEIDREMEGLLDTVERKLAREEREAQARAFWTAPAPAPGDLDLDAVLADYGSAPESRLRPLLGGQWHLLDRPQAEALLRLLAGQGDDGARALSRPGLRILGIERRGISFSDWDLYRLHLVESPRRGAIDLMASVDEILLLDGLSAILYNAISQGHIRIDSAERQSDYARFFCSALRAKKGRFEVVESAQELGLPEDKAPPETQAIRPWTLERTDEKGRSVYSGTICHSNALFRCELALDMESGRVDLLNDEPIATDLPIKTEVFDGPIRFLQSAD